MNTRITLRRDSDEDQIYISHRRGEPEFILPLIRQACERFVKSEFKLNPTPRIVTPFILATDPGFEEQLVLDEVWDLEYEYLIQLAPTGWTVHVDHEGEVVNEIHYLACSLETLIKRCAKLMQDN